MTGLGSELRWFRSKKAVRDDGLGNGSKQWQHQGAAVAGSGEVTWPGTGKGDSTDGSGVQSRRIRAGKAGWGGDRGRRRQRGWQKNMAEGDGGTENKGGDSP